MKLNGIKMAIPSSLPPVSHARAAQEPTPLEQARQTFNRLGERWWMQVIDGEFHQYGPNVFDHGLHKSQLVEPGYYLSMKNAHDFADAHLMEPLSVQFYKTLHAIACAHFTGDGVTKISALKVGKFRNDLAKASQPIGDYTAESGDFTDLPRCIFPRPLHLKSSKTSASSTRVRPNVPSRKSRDPPKGSSKDRTSKTMG